MNHEQAVKIAKDLMCQYIEHLSVLSIVEDERGQFSITFRADGSLESLRAYLANRNLVLFDDKENGVFRIYEP